MRLNIGLSGSQGAAHSLLETLLPWRRLVPRDFPERSLLLL